MKIKTYEILRVGLLAAVIALSTTILIPLPTGGMVHLGSAALFTVATLFGGFYGGLAGGIGSFLFDLVMGYSPYTLFSLIIKGVAGFLVGYISVGLYPPSLNRQPLSWGRLILALLVGTLWTALGYFIAWLIVLDSRALAIAHLPASFLTSGVGIVIALLLIPRLSKITRRLS